MTWRSTAACPGSDYLASGHWPNPDPSAGGSPVIIHGPNTAGTARVTLFGIDPLFRAHPERSFPAVSGRLLWAHLGGRLLRGQVLQSSMLESKT